MSSACSYARASTGKQTMSIETQEKLIADYIRKHRFVLKSKISEIERGSRNDIASHLRGSSAQNFIVYDVSRFSRSEVEANSAIKKVFREYKKLRIHFIHEEIVLTKKNFKAGEAEYIKFQAAIKAAQQESADISRRVRCSKEHLKNQGKYSGGYVPYGLTVNEEKRFEFHPYEIKVVEFIDLCLEARHRTDDEINAALKELAPNCDDTIHFKSGDEWTGYSTEPMEFKEIAENLCFYGIKKRGRNFTVSSVKTVKRRDELDEVVTQWEFNEMLDQMEDVILESDGL